MSPLLPFFASRSGSGKTTIAEAILERARTLEVLLTILTLTAAVFRDLKTSFPHGFVNRMIKLLSSHMIGVPLLHHHAESYRYFFDHQPPNPKIQVLS